MSALGDTRPCDVEGCNAVGKQRCGRCKVAIYCTLECQKKAWKAHKSECKEHVNDVPASPTPSTTDTKPSAASSTPSTTLSKSSPSDYNRFMKMQLEKIKEESPDMDHKERFKIAASMWKVEKQNKSSSEIKAALFEKESKGASSTQPDREKYLPELATIAEDGYPREALIEVHADPLLTSFVVPKKFLLPPLVLEMFDRSNYLLSVTKRTLVDAATFRAQFSAFTSNAFDNMPKALWKNVLVAGGAVLASLLPLDRLWQRRAAPMGYVEFDFTQRLRTLESSGGLDDLNRRTMPDFMRTVRWPTADVDVFVHGLTVEQAEVKAQVLLSYLTRELKGSDSHVAYIKTPNTLTIDPGQNRRKIQIITRVYADAAEVLNTFDIDCFCVGFDGEKVLMTGRCQRAINTKVNIVNLQLRGANYENRLIKYAERGFAVGVPGLDKGRIDRAYVEVKRQVVHKYLEFVGDGWSFRKYEESSGTLLRLILAEASARALGVVEDTFPGRKRGEAVEQNVIDYKLSLGGAKDTYAWGSGNKHGNVQVYQGTLRLADVSKGGCNAAEWKIGPMQRQPYPFDKWCKDVYMGSHDSYQSSTHDWKKHAEERKKKEMEEKAAEEARRAAERKAELDAFATAHRAESSAQIQKEAEKARLAQLALERTKREYAEKLEILEREVRATVEAAAEASAKLAITLPPMTHIA